MFDIGWSEMLVLLIVALIAIGPKELPLLMRRIGLFMRKAQGMASEFRASLDEIARDAEIEEARKAINAVRAGAIADPTAAMDLIDPDGALRKVESEVRQDLGTRPTDSPDDTGETAAAAAVPNLEPGSGSIAGLPEPEPAPLPVGVPDPVTVQADSGKSGA